MVTITERSGARSSGFLSRLVRDRKGNTIAMLAIAMLPTAAFAGSAVDMTRLYVIKSRLQQACDAGALAGRRAMIDDADHVLDPAARTLAESFFNNNFKDGWLGTGKTKKTFNESGTQQVVGSAETMVPMLLMGMFGSEPQLLQVTCAARMDVPDVDVMMVLDTTGSMACPPSGPSSCGQTTASYTRGDGTKGYYVTEASGSRMAGLRAAVLDFWDAMDTFTDDRTNVRYGIVPYSSTVNVGRDFPREFLADEHRYQSRRIVEDVNWGAPTTETVTGVTNQGCRDLAHRYPEQPLKFNNTGDASMKTVAGLPSANGGKCLLSVQALIPKWKFGPSTSTDDLKAFIRGEKVQNPAKYQDISANKNLWTGCIEEREVGGQDPDLIPTNNASRWKPMWPQQIYEQDGVSYWDTAYHNDNYFVQSTKSPQDRDSRFQNKWNEGNARADGQTHSDELKGGYATCGAPIQRLTTMTRAEMNTYLTRPEFRPHGGTYHDVGMIWGARLLSPTGPFANDTVPWPGRSQPNRHIIFMTDGEMSPNLDVYGMYGVERYDKRIGGGTTSIATLTNLHNQRFRAACEAARASPRNITVWVIAFGQALNDDLKACSTPPWKDHAFFASSDTELKAAFRKIAKQVGSLRVYQ